MSFSFENMSRIGNDSCYIDQTTIQNVDACNYTLQNFFVKDCGMSKAIQMATSQPCINYVGLRNVGENGCLVDQNSALLMGGIQSTLPKSKLDLHPRPYMTIPYLGKGSVDPVLESQLIQGETITNRKSITNLSEKNYSKYQTTPLIPSLQEKITNPYFCVEGVASKNWIRGGLPSRELTRDAK
jgi:hypothetical protein